jgi:Leucine-rich repeat (LRR) protein
MSNCCITSLEGLKNTPNIAAVQRLYLGNNKITYIDSDVFRFLTVSALQKLFLDHNKLTSIDKDAFKCLSNLVWLNLEHNQLTRLDPETFTHLPSLNLLVGHNQLTQENKNELERVVEYLYR